MSRRARVYDADIDALQHRLRSLLAAGDGASEQDVVGYETERDRVLDLIGDQMREQRDYDDRMRRLRTEMEQTSQRGADDVDGWFTGGYDAAHQQHLDAIAHTEDDQDDGVAADGGYPIRPGTDRYGDAVRHGNELRAAEMTANFRHLEDMINRPYRDDVTRTDDTDLDDRHRVIAEAPASQIGGMWFTPDDAAPGGVRPLTETELRAITDRVRATQAEAVADDITHDVDAHQNTTAHDVVDAAPGDEDGRGWER